MCNVENSGAAVHGEGGRAERQLMKFPREENLALHTLGASVLPRKFDAESYVTSCVHRGAAFRLIIHL